METKKHHLEPYSGPEIQIDEEIAIIANEPPEEPHYSEYAEASFHVKVEQPHCLSAIEDLKEAQEKARRSGQPIPTTLSTATTTMVTLSRPMADTYQKKRSRKSGTLGLHVCHICKEDFNTARQLANHQSTHEKILFSCNECPKKFKTKASFKNHKQFHKIGYQVCDQCGAKFKTKGNLSNQLKIHWETPYVCNVEGCNFDTQSYSWYVEHQDYGHLPTKTVKYDNCEKKFQIPTEMCNQRRSIHGLVAINV